MHWRLRKILRSAQVYFPFLIEARWAIQRSYLRMRGIPHDNDFHVLQFVVLKPGEILIDIGANRGQSIASMRVFEPTRKIVAFEPNSTLVASARVYFAEDHNCEILPFGLSDTSGELVLKVPSYNGWSFDAQASLTLDGQGLNYLASSIYGFDPKKLTIESRHCEIRRLDDFSLRPGFIKIDVEGHELEVLNGGINTIRQSLPTLMVEAGAGEGIRDLLFSFGYQAFHLFGEQLRKGALPHERNSIFIHASRQGRFNGAVTDKGRISVLRQRVAEIHLLRREFGIQSCPRMPAVRR